MNRNEPDENVLSASSPSSMPAAAAGTEAIKRYTGFRGALKSAKTSRRIAIQTESSVPR